MLKRTRNDTSRKPWTRSAKKPCLDKWAIPEAIPTETWLAIAMCIGHKEDANRRFFGLLACTCKEFYRLTETWSLSWEPKHRLELGVLKAVYTGDTPLLKQLVGEDTDINSVISEEDTGRCMTAAIQRDYFGVVSWFDHKNVAYSYTDMDLAAQLGNVQMFELGWKQLYNYTNMFLARAVECAHAAGEYPMLQYILNRAVDASLPEHVQCNVFYETKRLVTISVRKAIEDGDRSLFEKVRFPWRYTTKMLKECHRVTPAQLTDGASMRQFFVDFLRLMHDKDHKLPDTITEQLNSSCSDFERLRASLHKEVKAMSPWLSV